MATAAVQMQGPAVTPAQRTTIPFRQATVERVEILPSETLNMTAGAQRIERNVEGSGYVYSILLDVVCTTAANAANVAFTEDAPWSALDTVVFRDVNGEILNLAGINLFLANIINRNYANRWVDQSTLTNLGTTGAVGAGGSFSFMLEIPVGTNRRDLTGVLGNQDRAQKYQLRTDLAASGSVYGTAPTTLGSVVINKYYNNYSVPQPTSPSGAPQNIYPPSYGTLHFTTQSISEASPIGGATVNHFLRRIGNTIRWVALVFRSNGSRATADANAPTSIRFKIGEDTLFNETYRYRRAVMYQRFGFDFPAGVLVYDAMHDFDNGAGTELGDDYWHTQAIVNAQFQIAYPGGYGSTNNSLTFVVDDLIYQQPAGAGPAVVTQ